MFKIVSIFAVFISRNAGCLLLLYPFIILTSIGCQEDYSRDPRYMSYEELRAPDAIKISSAKPIIRNGKIYIYEDYLLINDLNIGIHIVDNSDPANPQPLWLINIPGNIDIAMKNQILYADSYVDLVAIDLGNLPEISVTKRIEGHFPHDPYQNIFDGIRLGWADESKGVVIGYDQDQTYN